MDHDGLLAGIRTQLQVGREDRDATLTGDGVRPLLFADLPVPGWIVIEGRTVAGDDALSLWIERALARS